MQFLVFWPQGLVCQFFFFFLFLKINVINIHDQAAKGCDQAAKGCQIEKSGSGKKLYDWIIFSTNFEDYGE